MTTMVAICDADRASLVERNEVPEWFRGRLLKNFGPTPAGTKRGFPLFCHWANALAGPRIWLDHWGTAMVDDVPVLVSEPYLTVGYDFSPVREFAARLDCDLVVTKESYWYPGKTIRLSLMPKSTALPVDGRNRTTSKTKVD